MSAEGKRKTRINVSWSDSELATLDGLARSLGTNRPGAIRWAVDRMDRVADGRRDSSVIADEVDGMQELSIAFQSTSTAVLVAIQRIGNNLNQIARRANRGEYGEVMDLTEQVDELRDEVGRYLEQLFGVYSIFNGGQQ